MVRVAVAVALVVAIGVAVVLAPPADEPLTRGQLERVRAQVDAEREQLGREGVLVGWTGIGDPRCLSVTLYNPSPENRARIEDQFPRTCAEREPAGRLVACTGFTPDPRPDGPIVVPDVRGLGIYAAERRVLAAGLTYTLGCLGDLERRAVRPAVDDPERHVRVAAQCPRAGERVEDDTEVALALRGTLPGGVVYRTALPSRQGDRPCADGRNPDPVTFRGGRPRPELATPPRVRFRRTSGAWTYRVLIRTTRALPPSDEPLVHLGQADPVQRAMRVAGSRDCYTTAFAAPYLRGEDGETVEVRIAAGRHGDPVDVDAVRSRPETSVRRDLHRMGCFG